VFSGFFPLACLTLEMAYVTIGSMTDKNIVLTGFMGSGKTAVSRNLAGRTGLKRVSTDDLIVEAEGRSIVAIFRDSGEGYFRKIEKQVVAEVCCLAGVIVDCGGGVILDEDNRRALKSSGTVFFLDASEQEIYQRIKAQTHRPLLNTPDPLAGIHDLLKQRRPLYACADITLLTDGKSVAAVTEEILKVVHMN